MNDEIGKCIDLLTKTTDIHNKILEGLGETIKKLQKQVEENEADIKVALYKIRKGEK